MRMGKKGKVFVYNKENKYEEKENATTFVVP
jgi:hypothetical protein